MVPATCDIAQRLGRSEDSATPRDVADAQMEAKEAITIRGLCQTVRAVAMAAIVLRM